MSVGWISVAWNAQGGLSVAELIMSNCLLGKHLIKYCLGICHLCSENNRQNCVYFVIHVIFVNGQCLCTVSIIFYRFLFFPSTQRCWILFDRLLIYQWNTMMIKRMFGKHYINRAQEDFYMSSCLSLQIFIFVTVKGSTLAGTMQCKC